MQGIPAPQPRSTKADLFLVKGRCLFKLSTTLLRPAAPDELFDPSAFKDFSQLRSNSARIFWSRFFLSERFCLASCSSFRGLSVENLIDFFVPAREAASGLLK